MIQRRRGRTATTLAALLVTAAVTLAGCGGANDAHDNSPRTTRSEDQPTPGPQSGTNPAGGQPVPGSSPANG